MIKYLVKGAVYDTWEQVQESSQRYSLRVGMFEKRCLKR